MVHDMLQKSISKVPKDQLTSRTRPMHETVCLEARLLHWKRSWFLNFVSLYSLAFKNKEDHEDQIKPFSNSGAKQPAMICIPTWHEKKSYLLNTIGVTQLLVWYSTSLFDKEYKVCEEHKMLEICIL